MREFAAVERIDETTATQQVEQLLTVVVVGGGPTGAELAGTFAELRRHVLAQDFDHIDPLLMRLPNVSVY